MLKILWVLISLLGRLSFDFFVRGFPACADIVLGLEPEPKYKAFIALDFAVIVAGADNFSVRVNKHEQLRNACLLYAAG